MRIAEARQVLIERFAASDSPAADADCLLCAVLACTRTWLRTWPERTLTDEQCERLLRLAERREAGEPIAHLLGEREFWSLPLQVSAATLIPRPDTEVLVEQALARVPMDACGVRVLDLGTGTGVIALALKSERPGVDVWAVDRIAAACELARDNATRNQVRLIGGVSASPASMTNSHMAARIVAPWNLPPGRSAPIQKM